MLDRGDGDSDPCPLGHPSGLATSRRAPRMRSQRPAADTSLNAAGRSASTGSVDSPGRPALIEEVKGLRARASQQDESLARLADALGALRSDREALRAENRELRRALREARRLSSRTRQARFA